MTPPEAPFEEPWQAQAFALVVSLYQAGTFTWSEWSQALATQIAANREAPYYESWLAALESLTRAKGLAAHAELDARKAAWEQAYLTTPHGKPVELQP